MNWTTVALTVTLLTLSNLFMTFAWYGHLKYKTTALPIVILVSWGIAFFEYCLQVPANRFGHETLSAPQLKVLQEAITFLVFMGVSYTYLKERLTFYDWIAMGLIFLGVSVSLMQPRWPS